MNMREKMARAMCLTGPNDPDKIAPTDVPYWKYYLPQADAGLDAMSEPTHKMVVLAEKEHEKYAPDLYPVSIWRAMINAAKEE